VAKVIVPLRALEALKGMRVGDLVKKAIRATGLGKEPCQSCDKRQQALNRFRLPK